MTALTLRLPEDKHRRLRALAQSRQTTINRLLDEMTTLMLAEYDAETRFQLRASRGTGQTERGLALLDKAAQAGPDQDRLPSIQQPHLHHLPLDPPGG